ncbi:thiamin pyrophosphokinase 1-like isoform X2 [Liolophura sinensis]|uniref:thiamin pyrophosphokinase 1-like isoform X2 n=1 Tax=Liolophura sinensis TaxID=3198878 RepID=UPI0031585C78
MEESPDTTVWKPLGVLKNSPGPKNLALVVLNRPLEPLQKVLENLWQKAIIKVAVDGGASRLEKVTKGNNVPDVITGDFDSCPSETITLFRQKGVEIIETPDQDFTDFTKCLKVVATKVNDSKDCKGVVVVGAFGGRLDHVMANINTLFEAREFLNKPVVLFSKESVALLLKPGRHKIEVQTGLEAEWCGLVPVGGPCESVTTTGLKWNLSHKQCIQITIQAINP